jgi:glycosyltransferase involved in cell wall biosynthesis
MNVVSISLDPLVLDSTSVVFQRNQAYAQQVQHFTVLVPATQARSIALGEVAAAEGIVGNKLQQLVRIYRRLTQLVKQKKVDVITTQDHYYLGLVAYLIARRYHLGFELQVHGLEKTNWLRRRLLRFLLSRASVVRMVSERLLQTLRTDYGLQHERVLVVPVYVDVRPFLYERTKERDMTKPYTILSINRLVPVKNIPLQIAAAAALKQRGLDFQWYIVGSGPLQAELQQSITALGLEGFVHLVGDKRGADLVKMYHHADCFVLTSNSEGWGMVILEAAAAELPIVMTDVGCAGEVITNGQEGLVIPVGDQAALTASLQRLSAEPAFAHQLAVAARQRVATLADFHNTIVSYVESWHIANEYRL